MIIAESFSWLHLPENGGTSMVKLFRRRGPRGVQVDPDDTVAKHDSVALRESRGGWWAGERRRFITARHLEAWLVRDWQHKSRHSNLPDRDFEPVRSGLFYCLRLGGTWVAPHRARIAAANPRWSAWERRLYGTTAVAAPADQPALP